MSSHANNGFVSKFSFLSKLWHTENIIFEDDLKTLYEKMSK